MQRILKKTDAGICLRDGYLPLHRGMGLVGYVHVSSGDFVSLDHVHTITCGPVLQAALLFENGMVLTLPRPARHSHLIETASAFSLPVVPPEGQGFLMEDGTFANRRDAALAALYHGQVREEDLLGDELYSENLW